MIIKFGSLFSGIGGFDLGLERAGMQCEWQVEIDQFCQKVLEKHWPNVKRYSDVRDCGQHNLEQVDLICGGFPCQDISNAGKRAGIDGERSGLWSEFHRIICELRPRYVLVENVSALLVRGMDRVLSDLAASGYDAEWDVLPAGALAQSILEAESFWLPTPQARDGKSWYVIGNFTMNSSGWQRIKDGRQLHLVHAIQLLLGWEDSAWMNPRFTEIVMGFPAQWTDLEGLEMP